MTTHELYDKHVKVERFTGDQTFADEEIHYTFFTGHISSTSNHSFVGTIEKQDDEYYCTYHDEMYGDLTPYVKIYSTKEQAQAWIKIHMIEDIDHLLCVIANNKRNTQNTAQ